jgi:hypothetical protein
MSLATFSEHITAMSPYLQMLESFENDGPLYILHRQILTCELEVPPVHHLKV